MSSHSTEHALPVVAAIIAGVMLFHIPIFAILFSRGVVGQISTNAPLNAISLVLKPFVTNNASDAIDLSFAGFAFEQASFAQFATDADGSPNEFSQNLITEVASRTGGAPYLRVGGTSGDNGHYNGTQTEEVVPPAGQSPPQTVKPYLRIGQSYFSNFKNFPGAKYILMVPLAHYNTQNALTWARQGLLQIGAKNLQAIEIGNEPDLYPAFNATNATKYVNNFLKLEAAILKSLAFALPKGTTQLFQALDISSGHADFLTIEGALELGINNNSNIKTMAYHLYQGYSYNDALAGLQYRIANHSAVVNAMYGFMPSINYLQFAAPGVPFILSEIGNTLGKGDSAQRNNLATALWNVDMQLNAMAIGVARVNMQQMVYEGFSMWLPQENEGLQPAVFANYYSQPFIADFIGTSGKTQVAEFPTDSPDFISAYTAFDNKRLSRIAIVNFQLWDATASRGVRPSTKINLTGLPKKTAFATVSMLTAPEGAYASDTLTWRGFQWTYASKGLAVQTRKTDKRVKIINGQLSLNVLATTAIMITLDS